jgi:hypothetical protein
MDTGFFGELALRACNCEARSDAAGAACACARECIVNATYAKF